MNKLISFFIILAAAACVGTLFALEPGYALFTTKDWIVQMPIWLFVAAVILLFFILNGLSKLSSSIGYGLEKARARKKHKRLLKSHHATYLGLIEFLEGNWKTAEKSLLTSAKKTNEPLINYLTAARAAHRLGHYDKRDEHLKQAIHTTPSAEIAVGITQAQLQLEQQQYEQALATLKRLRQLAPHHKYVLKQLQKLFVKLQDWQQLLDLSTELYKNKVIDKEQKLELEQQCYLQLFSQQRFTSSNALTDYWNSIPKHLHRNPQLVYLYCQQLHLNADDQEAINLIADIVRKDWDDELVTLYGNLKGDDLTKQISTAESWTKKHHENLALNLTLGQLYTANKIWGKARDCLQQRLAANEDKATLLALAELHTATGQAEEANELYRKAATIA